MTLNRKARNQRRMHTKISERLERRKTSVIIVAALIFLVALVVANYQFARQNNAGIDFLIRWLPMRLVLTGGLASPYAEEASEAIQYFQYGRLAEPGEIKGMFLYPYYIIFFMFPFALIENFLTARIIWMTFLEILIIIMGVLSLKMVDFKFQLTTTLLLFGFFLMSPRFLQPLVEGNPAILSAFFVVLTLFFLWKEQDIAAGIALAFATIKPQLVILFFIFVLFWSFSQKRWKVIIYALGIMAVLVGFSFLLCPSWVGEFLSQILIYQSLATPNTPEAIISENFSNRLQLVFNLLVMGLLLYEWRNAYGKGFHTFFWTAMLTFSILPLTSLPFGNRNLVILIPALIMIVVIIIRNIKRVWIFDLVLFCIFVYSWAFFFLPLFISSLPWFLGFMNYLPFIMIIIILLYLIRGKWNRLQSE